MQREIRTTEEGFFAQPEVDCVLFPGKSKSIDMICTMRYHSVIDRMRNAVKNWLTGQMGTPGEYMYGTIHVISVALAQEQEEK